MAVLDLGPSSYIPNTIDIHEVLYRWSYDLGQWCMVY
jgi:hypothetical protein